MYDHGCADALQLYGLTKVATVPGAVKQYRRVLQGFDEASRQVRQTRGRPSVGWALHGTESLPHILEDRMINPSSLGPKGQYGSGVYWWKGFPKKIPTESYLQSIHDEGIVTNLGTLPNKKAPEANMFSGSHGTDAQVTGPGDYHLRPRDLAIVDTATRAKNKSLGAVTADAQDARMRVVDSAIFQKARQHQLRMNDPKQPQLPPPTKQELVALLRRRRKGLTS